jgi:hypothetical protein
MDGFTFFGSIPFCPKVVTDSSLVGAGTEHPIGYTIQEIAYIYWKVKKISVNSSTTLLATNVDPPDGVQGNPANENGTYSTSGTIVSSASIYNDLICGATFDSAAGFSIDITNTFLYEELYYPYIKADTLAYTSINTDVQAIVEQINNIYSTLGLTQSISYTGNGGTCSIDFGIGAKTLTMYLSGISLINYPNLQSAWIWGQTSSNPFFYNFDSPPFSILYYYGFNAEASSDIEVSVDEYW